MLIVVRLNQLRIHAHPFRRLHHRTFHDRVDVEFLADLRKRLARILVTHRRGARNHAEGADLREVCDESVGHTIDEGVFRWIAAEVLQR